jgi:hypothetical protein
MFVFAATCGERVVANALSKRSSATSPRLFVPSRTMKNLRSVKKRMAGHWIAVLAIARGSRPARSQPVAVAASGTPMIARNRYRTGTSLR